MHQDLNFRLISLVASVLLCNTNIVGGVESMETKFFSAPFHLSHTKAVERQAQIEFPILGPVVRSISSYLGVAFLSLMVLLSRLFDVGGFIANLFGFGLGSADFIYRSLGGTSVFPLFLIGFVHSAFSARILGLMCLGNPGSDHETWKTGLCQMGLDYFNGGDVVVIDEE